MALVLGIDLGTSFSSAAALRDDEVVLVPDDEGRVRMPSIVHFGATGRISVGHEARARAIDEPENTILSTKRLLGRRFRDGAVRIAQSAYAFKISEGPNHWPVVEARGGPYSMPEICACIIDALRERAERFFDEPIQQAVVTVPANADDAQREQTRVAARIAGVEVLRLVNEPTAAALAYAAARKLSGKIAVYDFGGGTFDCSVLDWREDASTVLSTHGHPFLGGDDVDLSIARQVAEDFAERYGVDLERRAVEWRRLLLACEEAKRALSSNLSIEIWLESMAYVSEGPVPVEATLDRETLQRHAYPFIQGTVELFATAVSMAGLTVDQLDHVVLVGGSSRLPLVTEALKTAAGRAPHPFEVDPELAVAIGAAVEGHRLTADRSSKLSGVPARLVDIVPHAIGFATAGGGFDKVIPKNAPLPATGRRSYTTWRQDQGEMRFVVLQGDGTRADECARLGEFAVEGLPPRAAGEVEVELLLEVGSDGLLRASARETTTNLVHRYRVRVRDGLPGE